MILKSRDSKGIFFKKIGDDGERCIIKRISGSKEMGGMVFVSFLFISKQNHLSTILSEQINRWF